MESEKELPILIGVSHAGKENAQKVIHALHENGLRSGDTIGVEGYSRHELYSLQHQEEILKRLEEMNAELRAGMRVFEKQHPHQIGDSLRDELEYEYYEAQKFRLEENQFSETLFKYFRAHNIRAVGIDMFRKPKVFSKKVDPFVIGPVREKIWRASIAQTKPQFVVFGSGHLSTIAAMVPHKRVVNLALHPYPMGEHMLRTVERARKRYALRKKVKKFKNAVRVKLLPRRVK